MNEQEKTDILSTEKTVNFIKKNRIAITAAVAVIFAAAAGFGYYEALQHKKYQTEWSKLFLAELNFVSDPANSPKALEEFAQEYKNTQAGAYAALNLGNAYYQQGDYPKAELYFKQAMASSSKEVAQLAEVSLIATLTAQKLNEQAISQADSFAAKNPFHFALGQVAQHKALAMEQAGKTEEAKLAYRKITEDYPSSYYAAFAELRLKDLK